jgi:hypothetical protein
MQVDYVRVYQRSTPSNIPVLFSEAGTNRALALDSVLFTRDPFTVHSTLNFSQDQHTRVMLLVANADLQPGDPTSIISAQADDGQGHTYPLSVEDIGRLPDLDWITQLVARFPDELANANQVLITVNVRGLNSNQVTVTLTSVMP